MKKGKYLIGFAVIACFLFLGCKKKNISFKDIRERDSILFYLPHTTDFQSLRADDITLQARWESTQQKIKGSVQILSDSILFISIKPLLGIEMFRIEATHQDVLLIDKLNHNYYHINSLINNKIDLYPVLESFLLRFVFFMQENQFWATQSGLSIKQTANYDSIIFEKNFCDYTYVFNRRNYLLTQVLMSLKKYPLQLTIDYDDFVLNQKHIYPQSLQVSAQWEKTVVSGKIRIEGIHIDKNINLKPTNLEKYNEAPLSYILR